MRTSKFAVPPRALRGSSGPDLHAHGARRRRVRSREDEHRVLHRSPGGREVVVQSRHRREHEGRDDEEQALRVVRDGPPSAYKRIVNEAVANGAEYIALAPASIKTAVRHQIAYFKNIKARNYSKTTPLAPMTLADVKKITDFERTSGISSAREPGAGRDIRATT